MLYLYPETSPKDSSFGRLSNQKALTMTFTFFFFIYVSMCCVFFFHNQTVSVAFVPFLFQVTLKSSDIPLWKGRCTLVPSLIKRSCRKSANRWTYRIFPRALFFYYCSYAHFFFVSYLRAYNIKNQGAWKHLAAYKGYLPLHNCAGLMIAMKTVMVTAKVQPQSNQ